MAIMTRPGPAWPLLAAALALPGARAADWTVTPSLQLRAAYTDNARLLPSARARDEYSAGVTPAIAVRGDSARLKLSLDYALSRQIYTASADRLDHQLAANASGELVEDWLFMDARASISRQNISAFGPQLGDPLQSGGNTTTVRAARFSPYLRRHVRGIATAELRYARETVDSGGGLLGIDTDQLLLRLVGDNGGRGWNWDASADRRHIDDRAAPPVTRSNAALGLRFPLWERLSLFGSGGYEKFDYDSLTSQPAGRFWNAGLNWTPSPRTSVSASVGQRYFGDTYALNARYRMRSTYWQLSYSEDVSTTYAKFLSLQPDEVGNFLYQLWEDEIPDQRERIRVINLFLRLSQMMGPDANVNYFSHRYFLNKQWNWSMTTIWPRHSLAVALNATGRTAQSTSSVDSPLLAPGELTLDERTRQSALTAGWSWRMAPRSNLNMAVGHKLARSLSSGRRDRNDTLTLGLSRVLQPKVSASVNLRHSRHHSNFGGDYRENGVSASLTILL